MAGIDAASKMAVGGGFGRKSPQTATNEDRLPLILNRRLHEKIENYERAARKLRISGQTDAADVLARAAGRLRHITVTA
ncbi:MAG: hypothetical protein AB7F91_09835 [Parvularculaceae bacterium]